MAYTEADLTTRITALELALDRHERVVKFADREVTYSGPGEIIQKIDYFKTQLARFRGRPRQSILVGDKGLA